MNKRGQKETHQPKRLAGFVCSQLIAMKRRLPTILLTDGQTKEEMHFEDEQVPTNYS